MRTRIVKVTRPIVSYYDTWHVVDEKGEHPDDFWPDAWMKEAMGARMVAYFRAVWSIDGWQFKSFMAELPNNRRF